jgi:hypothetical protein
VDFAREMLAVYCVLTAGPMEVDLHELEEFRVQFSQIPLEIVEGEILLTTVLLAFLFYSFFGG